MKITDLDEKAFGVHVDIPGWHCLKQTEDGQLWQNNNRLTVIISGEFHDNRRFVHVSFSRPTKMPDYSDMQTVKRLFIGEDRKAIMVFPEKKYHVNIHAFCLHFYHELDGDCLPEFGKLGTI